MFWDSTEPPHWGGSFEHPQHMFGWEIREKNIKYILLSWYQGLIYWASISATSMKTMTLDSELWMMSFVVVVICWKSSILSKLENKNSEMDNYKLQINFEESQVNFQYFLKFVLSVSADPDDMPCGMLWVYNVGKSIHLLMISPSERHVNILCNIWQI